MMTAFAANIQYTLEISVIYTVIVENRLFRAAYIVYK